MLRCRDRLQKSELIECSGKVMKVVGLTVESSGPSVNMGDLCRIYASDDHYVEAEVVGFKDQRVQLMPFGDMEPQSNTEFVGELAQMSTMEQMQDMSGSLSTSKALGYVGKAIYAEVLDSETGITMTYAGTAEGVVMKNGEAYLVVGSYAICVDDIIAIAENTSGDTDSTTTDTTATGTTATDTTQKAT